ncbi:MAG: XshC-Cox1-family protein [Gemmatimonadetes bacterium]|nr:XshC-Cox1-family protein [Gemmatimonadota bacterium]
MSEQRAIARELVRASQSDESVVLASVVRTEGATYRAVGAHMVVRADGTMVGLLSSGCLEGEILERAARVRESGVAEVMTYDGRSDDELIWGLGTGCNGLVEILLERRTAEGAGVLGALLSHALDDASPSVIATVVRASGPGAPEVGARVLVRAPVDVSRDGDWGQSAVLGAAIADAWSAQVSARRGMTLEYVLAQSESSLGEAVTAQLSFELVVPNVELIICGSGPDAIPVTRLATSLGWAVTVVDPRPAALIAPERFGDVRVVECAHSEALCEVVAPSARAAAIVMSHNYERDLDYLDALARSDAAYIGVLGPRARTERLMRDLEARGRPYPESKLARLHAPIGLDVGGDGAEAIALSIIAEVSAVMHGRTGAHLRERAAPIHESPSLV